MRYERVTGLLVAGMVCMCAAIGARAGTNTWTVKGPPGGFFQEIQTSASSPGTTFAVFSRSLFRSTDAGVTWQLIRDFGGQVNDLCVDPVDANRVYLAVIDEGVMRVDVAAQTATAMTPAFPTPWSVGVSSDGNTLYYGGGDGSFHRSLNRGQTWEQRTTPGLGVTTRILVDKDDAQRVYAVHNGSLISRSASGGGAGSWQSIAIAGATTVQSLAKLPGSTTLAATTAQAIYVSIDDGMNWALRQSGWFWDVQVDASQPSGFVATASSQLGVQRFYRSTDSGASWFQFGVPPSFGARSLVFSGSTLIMAGDQGVQRSADNGATWTEASTPPVTSAPSLATTVAANSKVYAYATPYYVGGTGGLFSTSRDNGWERLNIRGAHALASEFGQAALAVKPGDPETVYLGAYGLGMFRSTDGGDSWSRFGTNLNGMGLGPIAFDPVDSAIMYVSVLQPSSTPAATVYRSTDGGVSWNPRSDGSMPLNVIATSMAVDPADRDRMFMTVIQAFGPAGSTGLYRSVNGGVEWTPVAFPGSEIRDVTISPVDSNVVYVVNGLGLQASADGGTTFVRNMSAATISNQSGSAFAIDPVVPSTLYYASVDSATQRESSYILRSVDNGTTWETLRGPNDGAVWLVNDVLPDPVVPSLIYVNTGLHGIATLEISPDVSVRIDGHSGVRPIGFPSSFTLHAENAGPYAATGVRLVTTLPAGLINVSATIDRGSCTVSGATVTCTVPFLRSAESVDAQVTYTTPGAALLAIATTLATHERDSNEANNTASASALAGEVVDLEVSVTAPATVDHGDNLTYAVTVRNNGPMDATTPTLLLTPAAGITLGAAPAGCTAVTQGISCPMDRLAAGATQTFSFPATASAIGPLSVTASASPKADAADANTANNSPVITVNSRAVGDLAISATDTADPVTAGTGFEYRITVRNNGPDEVPDIVATVSTPGTVSITSTTQGTCAMNAELRCTLGTLASGASATIIVSTSVANAGSATLSASVTSAGTDRVAGNNTAQESTQITARSGGGGGGGGGGGRIDFALLASALLMLAARTSLRRRGPPPGTGLPQPADERRRMNSRST